MLRTLIVPLDGSELAERALPYAIHLARARAGKLVLVRAALGPVPSGLEWEPQQLAAVDEAERYLAATAERLVPTGVPVETVAPYGHAAREILTLVEQSAADGVVMPPHGRTGLAPLLSCSVAEAVI